MLKSPLSLRLAAPLALAILAPAMANAAGQEKIPEGMPADTSVVAGEDPGTENLNRRQAEAATQQNDTNAASANNYNSAVAQYEAERTAVAAARARYEEELRANREAREAYDRAYAQWQADVAACNAGDRSRCAPPLPR